jgi:hypothetical protein
MRAAVAFCAAVLLCAPARAAQPWPAVPYAHTRGLSPEAAALIVRAAARSSIVDSLLDAVERSDLIVYVGLSMIRVAPEAVSTLNFMVASGGVRYLAINIDPWQTSPTDRIVMLAHELRHALEVAEARDVRDAAGLRHLYQRIGQEIRTGHFETASARLTGLGVRGELDGHKPVELRELGLPGGTHNDRP